MRGVYREEKGKSLQEEPRITLYSCPQSLEKKTDQRKRGRVKGKGRNEKMRELEVVEVKERDVCSVVYSS